jgi:hypothetical protein
LKFGIEKLKFGIEKRLKSGIDKLKFGIEKRLKSGIEKLKFGMEKRLKSGKELAVAAPMMAKADKDTIIAGTRREAPCCAASGCLSPCVSLSAVSATCVPYVSAQSQDFSSPPISKKAVAWTIQRRLSRDCPPKFRSNHGLIWLMISYSQRSRMGGATASAEARRAKAEAIPINQHLRMGDRSRAAQPILRAAMRLHSACSVENNKMLCQYPGLDADRKNWRLVPYSHSIVPGGLLVTS